MSTDIKEIKCGDDILYFSISSTSPVLAGFIAILKSINNSLNLNQCKEILRNTSYSTHFKGYATYIAKGLARNEILFASYYLESILRPQLFNMLKWKIGAEYGYGFSVGKHQKYTKKYLSDDDWTLLMETYRLDSIDNCWQALASAHKLFRKASLFMCENLNLPYPEYDRNVTKYIYDFCKSSRSLRA